MIVYDVVQGTAEWASLRSGIPTASCFDLILTSKTRKPSTQQSGYLARLVTEWLTGHPMDEVDSAFMERGKDMEPEAVRRYQFDQDVTAEVVGFVTTDDCKAGCSPDRLVGADGLLEVKCPGMVGHVGYLLEPERLKDAYWSQVQGQLWVTGRRWVDLWSYSPALPPVRVRIEPEPEYLAALATHVAAFVARLDAAKALLLPYRIERARTNPTPERSADDPVFMD